MSSRPKDALPRPIDAALEALDDYQLVIDARSPSEFALDHLPGAVNLPVLDDAQRARVGTLYKQVGAFEAKRLGAGLVASNIGQLLAGPLAQLPREARVLVYCWRGGNRSGSLATVMARVGWRTEVIEGGYREFRRRVIADLQSWPSRHHYRVLAGRTGSGKSLVLEALQRLGAQVLDLEALAHHRGSVLGHLPDAAQPSQKLFETRLWQFFRRADASRPVYVESESRKVGQCQVPAGLITTMRASPGIHLLADDATRVALLLRDYRHFVDAPDRLLERLQALVAHHGQARVQSWSALARSGRWPEFVQALLGEHYDPAYEASMRRNFAQLAHFASVTLRGPEPADIDAAARAVLAGAQA